MPKIVTTAYSLGLDKLIVLCYNAQLDPKVAQNYFRIFFGRKAIINSVSCA